MSRDMKYGASGATSKSVTLLGRIAALLLLIVVLASMQILSGCAHSKETQESTTSSTATKVELPKTHILYQNEDYTASTISITLDATKQTKGALVDIYAAPGAFLIATVFVHPGDSYTIDVANWHSDKGASTGEYSFRLATGDEWLGNKQLFGKTGSYTSFRVDGIPTLNLAGTYTLPLHDNANANANYTFREMSFDDFCENR